MAPLSPAHAIVSKGHDGNYYLAYASNRVVFPRDTEVILPNSESKVKVVGGSAPHKPSSTGRVHVKFEDKSDMSYFPSVVGARWVKLPEKRPKRSKQQE